MNLKQSLIIALTLSIISLGSWELYWRSQGKIPDLDDDKNLWAVQRAKVENATTNDVILLGSSRVLFDIQLDEWEEETGIRPIQLACAGSSPIPTFHDIVENTEFKGTVVVGITPGLFFSTTFPEASPWKRAQTRVDYYEDRTYAQRMNHWLSLPLQKNFVFISTSEEGWSDDIDLKSLLNSVALEDRTGKPQYPPFNSFSYIDEDRNNLMSEKTATDTSFANGIKEAWKFLIMNNKNAPEKEATTKYFSEDAEKFIKRGGNLILLRCPSSGWLKGGEDQFLPRNTFWDELVTASKGKGYYYEDYDNLKDLECPELSHLSAEDAKYFTKEIVKIMKKDQAIPTSKTN
ncbi:hypothetical protein ATE92_1241 [Ulvibacter sp. MAR_2010_11]|uniref:hypothetical protein n=1 Tax=Ulvibacter sp. MAR_2010_11 TaxID=1250229 RepID=UPI000C2B9BB8|nr:hypothetical protein [Ulvibacter sp. MAR_2010_11]PKA83095.1 hypothetical protein ATE92_1241 [Ulvibacter sp. MAR_2010_11]